MAISAATSDVAFALELSRRKAAALTRAINAIAEVEECDRAFDRLQRDVRSRVCVSASACGSRAVDAAGRADA